MHKTTPNPRLQNSGRKNLTIYNIDTLISRITDRGRGSKQVEGALYESFGTFLFHIDFP
jgi:hypothetical protein